MTEDEKIFEMLERLVGGIEALKPKPKPADFSIISTQDFPPIVDHIIDIPENTKFLLLFPKASATIDEAEFSINNQLLYIIPVGQVYPAVIRILPEWKFLTIPSNQPTGVLGQADLIFTSHMVETYNQTTTVVIGSPMLSQGIVNVAVVGTRVPLSLDLPCREVTIIAKRLNGGYIYVGNSLVSSVAYAVELEAKDSITLAVTNANLIYIDASVAGEGISYVAI